MNTTPWWVFACASAACAAVVPVLGKYGLRGWNPDMATVLRSVSMTDTLLVFASATDRWSTLTSAGHGGTRALACLLLTGIAGAASWIFYFKALAAGEASKVAPLDKLSVPLAVVLSALVLGDRPSALNWAGVVLVVVGILMATAPRS